MLLLLVIILLGVLTTYIVKINEEYPPSMITMNPPSEFMKYDVVNGVIQSYIYRDPEVINELHKIISTKKGRKLKDVDDFNEVAKFDYGYKGVIAKIDGEGRVVVPIRIIDLKERSTIDYFAWKTYQIIHNAYFVYYMSEPDEKILALVEQIDRILVYGTKVSGTLWNLYRQN